MKRLFFMLVLLSLTTLWATDKVRNPWYIEFSDNSLFSNFQLTEHLDIPSEFGQMDTTKQTFLMKLSKESILDLYFARGYFSASVKLEIQREFYSLDSAQRGYLFYITEGPQYTLDSVYISIKDDQTELIINPNKLRTNKKERYNQQAIIDDVEYVKSVYRKEGYLHTSVDYNEIIDTIKHSVYLYIDINPRTQVRMGRFKSVALKPINRTDQDTPQEEGLSDTAWLNTLWQIPSGNIIDGEQFSSFKNKLFSTQLFTQIKLEDSLGADGFSDIHLQVIERIPGDAKYSVFFEEYYGFGASAGLRHKNFFGAFHEFSTSIFVAQNKQEAAIAYANPLLFGTGLTFIPTAIRFEDRLSFNHEETTLPAYADSVEKRIEVINRGDITFGLSPNIRFRGTLDSRFVNKNNNQVFKFKYENALTFDFTDDYFNPKRGIRFSPTIGIGTNLHGIQMIGRPYTYSELTANLYFPIIGTLFGAISGNGGIFFNEALEEDARIFYQGGARSVRSYRFRSIFASYESIENGDTLINTSLTPRYLRLSQELRFNIPSISLRNWQVVQFWDWAKVMDKHSDLFKGKISASLGLGLRYHWQFLTLRLDYAFKKDFGNYSPENYSFSRFTFDLSQAF